MNPPISYKWQHFADLPDTVEIWRNPEVDALRNIWAEQKLALEFDSLEKEFNQKLLREYAIEGGIIERVYTLDRGITQLLIDRGIDASLIPHSATNKDPLRVARMIQAHQDVLEGVFEMVKGNRPLSTSAIREMHAALLRDETTIEAIDSLGRIVPIMLLKGEYKKQPNNPLRPDGHIHEYCPPEHVASEMDRMISLHQQHERNGVPPVIEAAWLHHVFTQIHPFQDGNGRVARLLASYVLIKAGFFPLALNDERDREVYIRALEQADYGDISPLIRLFHQVLKRTFVKALQIAGAVQQQVGIDLVIAAAKKTIQEHQKAQALQLDKARKAAGKLHQTTVAQLGKVESKLRLQIGGLGKFTFRVDAENNDGQRRYFFHGQVIETARALDYFANTGVYHSWARLILQTEEQADVLISFHGLGQEFRGLVACSVCVFRRVSTEENQRETTQAVPACDEPFLINYLEDLATMEGRFDSWLNTSLTKALSIWQTGL
ncbi:MAG: Fic family protein [Bryobacterales bacterium]|nr:Fic family protein [Bryobacterales bacterium]